jgi:two-component system, OmpR family, sensor histidine kinase KdpD
MARGRLRIYLGAAPGVGKTYAMLDEGHRRRERGADVVVGIVETHGRARTLAQLRDLEVIARRRVHHRDATFEDLDLDAVISRRPQVCLVDELAHTNAPGGRHERRWQDVDALLAAGIDVVTTVNVQHLESLNDVVASITGVTQRETVPDAFVRGADQIELVDMSPEALRRRLAHGNVYPSERIDAALANYFKTSNLTALRELALLWVADRVEDSLQAYLAAHGISGVYETRERVVVAVTGRPTTDALIRRAARMAGRTHGDLLGVRVARTDGLSQEESSGLAGHRRLLTELGGTYHEIVGDDIASALLAFARSEHATQLVLGGSGERGWRRLFGASVLERVVRDAAAIDVHVIASEQTVRSGNINVTPALTGTRRVGAWVGTALSVPALTAVLLPLRDEIGSSTVLLLFLALVVGLAALGGRRVAVVAAVAASLAVNVAFVPPYGTFTVADRENVIALAVFVMVGATVGVLVDRTARRGAQALRARTEAEALARATATMAASEDPVPTLVEHVRTTFGQEAAAVLGRDADGTWLALASAGSPIPDRPEHATSAHGLGSEEHNQTMLVLSGAPLSGDDHRLLATFCDQLAIALDASEQARRARAADTLAEIDRVRTGILQSVSHDLRTPIATIKAYASGLRLPDATWTESDRADAHLAIEDAADRLDTVVANLLDASRLQAGALAVHRQATSVHELVEAARRGHPADTDVATDLPLIDTDPALAERAIANLIDNAVKHEPNDRRVLVDASAFSDGIAVRIVDHGPGIPLRDRDDALRPFHRLGDAGDGGVGLGLAIAAGMLEAVGARLELDDTPGAGLTATITFPTAALTRDAHAANVTRAVM